MRDAVIVEAVRTPVGKRNGGLSSVHPVDLSAHLLRAVQERSGIDPELVDDVVWGVGAQVGDQSFNVAVSASHASATEAKASLTSKQSMSPSASPAGADQAKLNPNGGAIALGHPICGSGARIMTTLIHHLRDTGGRYGLQTMCEGGGMANATIVEAL